MKYELETIPIWDAYKEKTECPLCLLQGKAEQEYIDFFLGNSVMVPEIRVEVNKTGFCPDHFLKLFKQAKNRHGLGLVAHTHFMEQNSIVDKASRQIQRKIRRRGGKKEQDNLASAVKKALFSGNNLKKMVETYTRTVKTINNRCMICTRIETRLKRYAFTIVYLWQKDPEFQKVHDNSRGFCWSHAATAMSMALEVLSSTWARRYIEALLSLQRQECERLEAEIRWFTQKFDYQNKDKSWETSKDALERTIQKIIGLDLLRK